MNSKFTCEGITCGGCANAIKNSVSKVSGVSQVDVDVATKVVTVSHSETVTNPTIEQALRKAGFEPTYRG